MNVRIKDGELQVNDIQVRMTKEVPAKIQKLSKDIDALQNEAIKLTNKISRIVTRVDSSGNSKAAQLANKALESARTTTALIGRTKNSVVSDR